MNACGHFEMLGLVVTLLPAVLAGHICSPEACFEGQSLSSILSVDYDVGVFLTPGNYPSDSKVPSFSSLAIRTPSNITILTSDSGLIVPTPSNPMIFLNGDYGGQTSRTAEWGSAFFPDGWYGLIRPGVAVWGAIPNAAALPIAAGSLTSIGSDACATPCGAGGACTPNANNTAGTCICLPGWTGELCDQCEKGFFGPTCSPCSSNCTVCDDGQAGTGGCLGAKSSQDACQCAHGTCTSSGDCICAAGWTTNGDKGSDKCSTCADGFYDNGSGDCSACPLGCTACELRDGATEPTCTACTAPLSLSNADPPTCEATTGNCGDGRYWDDESSSCQTCSPACDTCTGPGTSDCLACASPRVNLASTCVGYDASTGVCDSSLSQMQGVFIVNNEKSKCDACPAGCLTCSIPSFSSASTFDSNTCTACQEGFLLQGGKCVQKCDDGHFMPEGGAATNGTCKPCDSSCVTCVGSATTCTRCPYGSMAVNGKCVQSCPANTIASNGTCLTCSTDCATCSSPLSSSSCLSCPPHRPVLSQGRCMAFCPRTSYFDASSSSCKPCNSACGSCTGPSDSDCTTCNDNLVLDHGSCIDSSCGKGGLVPGLGVCLAALVVQGGDKQLAFIIVPVAVIVIAFIIWYVVRQRRQTRADSRAFARNLKGQEIMRRIADIKFNRVFGMHRIRMGRGRDQVDEEFDIVDGEGAGAGGGKRGKKPGTWDSYMDLESRDMESGKRLRQMFKRDKDKDKGKNKAEWGEEIPLDSPRFGGRGTPGHGHGSVGSRATPGEKDSHEFAPPPPYYPSISRTHSGHSGPSSRSPLPADGHAQVPPTDSISTSTGSTPKRAPGKSDVAHGLGDSKTKVVSMSSPESPTFQPRTLRPPPRPYRAPVSDGALRPVHRASQSYSHSDSQSYSESPPESVVPTHKGSDARAPARFDEVYLDNGGNGLGARAETRKSLPDVPYSPVFGTLSLAGHGEDQRAERAEHTWI